MKYLISLLFVIPTFSYATPFYVSGDAPATNLSTSCLVRVDAGAPVNGTVELGSVANTERCRLDLGPLALVDGAHAIDAAPVNVWGTGAYSAPLNFTKGFPSAFGAGTLEP